MKEPDKKHAWRKEGSKVGQKGKYKKAKKPIEEGEYAEGHAELIIGMMEQGKFDYEIMAEFNISREPFYRWLKQYPEFGKAHEIGKPKRFVWWMTEGKKRFADSSDKGYKYWVTIMNNMFSDMGWTSEYGNKNGTQININNMQVNQIPQTEFEVLESIKANFATLNSTTQTTYIEALPELKEIIKDAEFREVKPD